MSADNRSGVLQSKTRRGHSAEGGAGGGTVAQLNMTGDVMSFRVLWLTADEDFLFIQL